MASKAEVHHHNRDTELFLRLWYHALMQTYTVVNESAKDASQRPYLGGQYDRAEAFGRLMLGDVMRNDNLVPFRKATREDVQNVWKLMDRRGSEVDESTRRTVCGMIANMSPSTTRLGRMGCGPFDMEVGDEVWVFRGGNTPVHCQATRHFPNLGHVIVAALICDQGLAQELLESILKEAILRNVVWMLTKTRSHAGMAERAYLEPTDISEYRLAKTFEASLMFHQLIMFQNLFFDKARIPSKSLRELRDELFGKHGAPPSGVSINMVETILVSVRA
ncbi:hypothetical protein CC80DRAFT_556337 [Byssothecium circinans]|uniref:Uncharacterized protein n=1 Tax=Byssothecium circinans TaxID=147558 RepID=A0A6A5T673_9PLEO|nr:hypothetical protein CC80DRAFT_556337 [Byssothecium circinans]